MFEISVGRLVQGEVRVQRRGEIPRPVEDPALGVRPLRGLQQQLDQRRMKIPAGHQRGRRRQQRDIPVWNVQFEIDHPPVEHHTGEISVAAAVRRRARETQQPDPVCPQQFPDGLHLHPGYQKRNLHLACQQRSSRLFTTQRQTRCRFFSQAILAQQQQSHRPRAAPLWTDGHPLPPQLPQLREFLRSPVEHPQRLVVETAE